MGVLKIAFFLLSFYVTVADLYTIPPAQQVVCNAYDKIYDLISQRTNNQGDFLFLGGLVRLAFHDCIGKDGCDGCLDYNNIGNNGLEVYTKDLNALYEEFKTDMSRSDFWMFSAAVALEMAPTKGKRYQSRFDASLFKFGRKDCSDTNDNETDTAEVFPSSKENWTHVKRYFKEHFGFTGAQTVALMGAHTLGSMHKENSGYKGEWVGGNKCSSRVNVKYYKNFVKATSFTERSFRKTGKTQWRVKGGNFLNADIALAYDFETINDNGDISCNLCGAGNTDAGCCQRNSETKDQLDRYLDQTRENNKRSGEELGNKEWLKDFQDVFYLMIERELKNGKALQTACPKKSLNDLAGDESDKTSDSLHLDALEVRIQDEIKKVEELKKLIEQ